MVAYVRVGSFNLPALYVHNNDFGSPGSGAGQFVDPRGIAVGADGLVYVADSNLARLTQFSASGVYAQHRSVTGLMDVAASSDAALISTIGFNASANALRVYYTSAGLPLYGSGAYSGYQGYRIAAGNPYVFMYSDSPTRTMLRANHNSLGSAPVVGSTGAVIGTFYDIAVNRSNHTVYATDSNGWVRIFNSSGIHINNFQPIDPATGTTFVPTWIDHIPDLDALVIFNSTDQRVVLTTPQGNPLSYFDAGTTAAFSVAASHDGEHVYVVESQAGAEKVRRFTADAKHIQSAIGFQPKAAIFFMTGTPSGTVETPTAGDATRKHSRMAIVARAQDVPGTNLAHTMEVSAPSGLTTPASSMDVTSGALTANGVVTFDVDGFTFDWNSHPEYRNTFLGYRSPVYYVLFGGDLDGKRATTFTITNVLTEGGTFSLPVTDGFIAKGGYFWLVDNDNETGGVGGFGYSPTGALEGWARALGGNAFADPSEAATLHSSSSSILLCDHLGTRIFEAVVTSVTAGNINFLVILNDIGIGHTYSLDGLLFRGTTVRAQTLSASAVLTYDVNPIGALITPSAAAAGTDTDHLVFGIGALDDAGNQRAISASVRGGVATSETRLVNSNVRAMSLADPASTFTWTQLHAEIFGKTIAYTPSASWRWSTLVFEKAVTSVSGTASITTGGTTAPLKFNHTGRLTANAQIVTSGPVNKLTVTHKLKASAIIAMQGPNPVITGGHPLSGHAVIEIQSNRPANLKDDHALTAHAVIDIGHKNNFGWIGNINRQTHQISGYASITISGDETTKLRLGHALRAVEGFAGGQITMGGSHQWIPQNHALTGNAFLELNAGFPVIGRDSGEYVGYALLELTANNPFLKTGVALKASATISVGGANPILTGQPLPEPKQLGAYDEVGTVNLFMNPSFEGSANIKFWEDTGNATNAIVSEQAWHGTKSLKVTLSNATANSGVLLHSIRGIGIQGRTTAYLGQLNVRSSASMSVEFFSRITYMDGTTVDGELQTHTITSTGWRSVLVPAVVTDRTKMINYITIVVRRPATASGQHIYVDGVQIEEDRGQGHTAWAYGGFSDGSPESVHRWHGAANASLTIRNAIKADLSHEDYAGKYIIESKLYRCDANGNNLLDISSYVINCATTSDPERDVSWSMEADILNPPDGMLEPFVHWVRPWQRVTLPNGKIREGFLGLMVVMPSGFTEYEWGRVMHLQASSAEQMLKMQGTKGHLFIKENTPLRKAMRILLQSCHLGERDGRDMFILPQSNDRAKRDMIMEKKEDALTCANEIAKKAHWHPIYCDKNGWITTTNRKERRLNRMTPVRVYAANVDVGGGTNVDPWVNAETMRTMEIVGEITSEPHIEKFEDNKIIVVSVNPRKRKVRATHYIDNEGNPVSPKRRKRIKEKVVKADVNDEADAAALAAAIAEEINSSMETINLSLIPDPEVDFTRQVIYLYIYNLQRQVVAVGRYKVMSVTYAFTDDEAMMTLKCGYVRDTSMSYPAGGNPFAYELGTGVVEGDQELQWVGDL